MVFVEIATNLPRYMVCNGSHNMPQHAPFNVDDTVKEEGNAAHWLIEQVHKGIHTSDELVDRKAFNGYSISEEMVEHVTPFLKDTFRRGTVECDTSYGDGVNYQINGRADFADFIVHEGILDIFDFKYGWSLIEPEGNWTLISHAIGWLTQHQGAPVEKVRLRIYQPRPHHALGHIREHIYHIAEIWELWHKLQTAILNPAIQLVTSNHCSHCPALATCPAAQKACMNAVDVSEVEHIANIDDAALAFLLGQIERSIKMLEASEKAYTELALHRLKAGRVIPGYGTEKGLTNRQWKDNITVEVANAMFGKDISKKQLVTPKQAIDRFKLDEGLVNMLCERKEKSLKLAKISPETQVKRLFAGMQL